MFEKGEKNLTYAAESWSIRTPIYFFLVSILPEV